MPSYFQLCVSPFLASVSLLCVVKSSLGYSCCPLSSCDCHYCYPVFALRHFTISPRLKEIAWNFPVPDSGSDWLCMENFTPLSLFFENKFGGGNGFLHVWKGKCFLWNAAFPPCCAARPRNAAEGWSVCFLSPLRQSTLIRLDKEPLKNQMWSSTCSAEAT